MTPRHLLIILCLTVLPSCAETSSAQEDGGKMRLAMDQTPVSLRAPAAAMDWLIPVSVMAAAGGIALAIWVPAEASIGLAIASGGGIAMLMCIICRLTMSHPWIMWSLGACVVGGLAYGAWEMYRRYYPATNK